MTATDTKDVDVLVLCGGLGTRLADALGDSPKSMAKIGERPFIDILIEYIATFGFKRFILCAGYKAEIIQEYYKRGKNRLEILIAKEKKTLGTGGAIKNAEPLIQSNPFLVVNGDSFCYADLYKFVDFHISKKALLSIALVNTEGAKDYGSVEIDSLDRIVRFKEKGKAGQKGIINAGIYLFSKEVLSLMPGNEKFSLEYDFFPKNIGRELFGYLETCFFIDIGTPERYEQAKRLLKDSPYV
jgi:D-glycero-alpha-D-manno-heptose 1-phosphate guanylyltransferase